MGRRLGERRVREEKRVDVDTRKGERTTRENQTEESMSKNKVARRLYLSQEFKCWGKRKVLR